MTISSYIRSSTVHESSYDSQDMQLLLLLPCQVYWTREASEAISTAGSKGLLAFAEKCTTELNKIVNLVRGSCCCCSLMHYDCPCVQYHTHSKSVWLAFSLMLWYTDGVLFHYGAYLLGSCLKAC
jgi:hypothetical protein